MKQTRSLSEFTRCPKLPDFTLNNVQLHQISLGWDVPHVIWVSMWDFGTYRKCTKPLIKAHDDITCGARGLNFHLSLHLHTYLMYASSKGLGIWVFLYGSTYVQLILSRGKKFTILHMSCRTSDLQFSLVLQTHVLVLWKAYVIKNIRSHM